MPPTVLIVTPFYYEPPRQKVMAMELAKALSKVTKVVVATSRIEGAPAYEHEGNLTVYRLRPGWYLRSIPYTIDLALWLKLARLIRREKIDGVIAMTIEFMNSFMAAIAKDIAGVPMIAWVRGERPRFEKPVLDLLPRLYDQTLGRYTVARADRIFLQTESQRSRVYPLGVKDDKIAVLPNATDMTRFHPGLDVSDVRQELGIPEGTPVVLFVGAVHMRKGVGYLMDASEAILAQHPEAKFLVAGTGPSLEEAKARAACIAPDRFVFPGFRKDIGKLMNLASVFVLPSLREGFPQTIVEAYSCGVPVVATAVGGVPDILKDWENGFVIPPRDPDAIAQAVNTLLGDEPLRQRIAAHNHHCATTLYTMDRIVRDTLATIEELRQGKESKAA